MSKCHGGAIMCTEPDMPPLPPPCEPPQVTRLSDTEWLDVLLDPATDVELGLASTHPITARRITNRRTPANRYTTNYLFFSPDAQILVQSPDRVRAVAPGTVVWFPPGVPYALYLHGDARGQTLYRFRFSVARGGALVSLWGREELVAGRGWYPQLVHRAMRELGMPDRYSPVAARSLLVELSTAVLRARRSTTEQGPRLTAGQLRELHAYLVRHIAHRLSPSDLATRAGLSPAYFTKVFVKTVGVSPRRWIMEQRIRHGAQLLLDTTARISEIAYWLGYDEPRLFTRQFTAVMGRSPRVYRGSRC
ncbi:MAG: helix-turn-helix domain-containing protein [Chitinivibrionales bacterium]|nr:helix-turn-helix domain-containing protein [Chitinivibrionales bacterium]